MHVVPLQQPLGHEAELQIHCPLVLLQACMFAAQDEQVFAAPHWASDCWAKGRHVVAFTQQPIVQELAVQTQELPLHSRPAPHAVHGEPFDPQVSMLVVLHCWRLLQQPEHDVESQMQSLPLQRWPCSQVWHASPPVPQAEAAVPPTQALPLQQPLHELVVHRHSPPVQPSPAAQTWHLTPPVPHAALVPVSMHCSFASQHPFGQVAAEQTHLPCALHSCLGPHAVQSPPPAPQCVLSEV